MTKELCQQEILKCPSCGRTYYPPAPLLTPIGYLCGGNLCARGQTMSGVSHRPRNHSRIPHWCSNLKRRPARPARLRGRVQLAAERVLYLYGTATTSDVVDYAHALRLTIQQEKRHNWLNFGARRALESIGAVKVGRAKTIGSPWLWTMDASMGKDGKA